MQSKAIQLKTEQRATLLADNAPPITQGRAKDWLTTWETFRLFGGAPHVAQQQAKGRLTARGASRCLAGAVDLP